MGLPVAVAGIAGAGVGENDTSKVRAKGTEEGRKRFCPESEMKMENGPLRGRRKKSEGGRPTNPLRAKMLLPNNCCQRKGTGRIEIMHNLSSLKE